MEINEIQPQKWEYYTLWLDTYGVDKLNEMGQLGWELLIVYKDDDKVFPIAYFKRPIWSD